MGSGLRRLPDFLIGGVPKAGTTSLFNWVALSPDVYMPKQKEVYFFSFEDKPEGVDSDVVSTSVFSLDDYCALFLAASANQRIGEASTSYLYTARLTIDKILRVYDAAGQSLPKVIFVLRDPVRRFISHYKFYLQKGLDSRTIEEVVSGENTERLVKRRLWGFDYEGCSRYAKPLRLYLDSGIPIFPVIFEEMVKGDFDFGDVARFLEISPPAASGSSSLPTSNVTSPLPSRHLGRLMYGPSKVRGYLKRMLPQSLHSSAVEFRNAFAKAFSTDVNISDEILVELEDRFASEKEEVRTLLARPDLWK